RARRAEHDESALCTDLAGAPALRTRARLSSCASTRASAFLARSVTFHRELALGALHAVFERDRCVDAYVRASGRTSSLARSHSSESTPEEIREEILEVAQDVAHARA